MPARRRVVKDALWQRQNELLSAQDALEPSRLTQARSERMHRSKLARRGAQPVRDCVDGTCRMIYAAKKQETPGPAFAKALADANGCGPFGTPKPARLAEARRAEAVLA